MAAEGKAIIFYCCNLFILFHQHRWQKDLNQTWPVGRKRGPQNFGHKKHQILDHFFRDFHARHRISPERNVTWTNKNAIVNLQCVPYKVTYFPGLLTQKRLRSVYLLWRNIRRPLRCSHQSYDICSFISNGSQIDKGRQANIQMRLTLLSAAARWTYLFFIHRIAREGTLLPFCQLSDATVI